MFVLVAFFYMIGAVIAVTQLTSLETSDPINRTTGFYKDSTKKLEKSYTQRYRTDAVDLNKSMAAANANIAAIRVCRQLSYEMRLQYNAGDMTCSNYRTSSDLYTFIGAVGTVGTIETMYSAPVSSTLSCSNPGPYGRYIFTRALPYTAVAGKNINYNLMGITNSNSDPCGFHEILN